MTRTFKTDPLPVKAARHPGVLQEMHDHRSGPCDLPATPALETERLTRCTWGLPWGTLASDPKFRCGCPLCTAQAWRRRENRRIRHTGRQYVRTGWRAEFD